MTAPERRSDPGAAFEPEPEPRFHEPEQPKRISVPIPIAGKSAKPIMPETQTEPIPVVKPEVQTYTSPPRASVEEKVLTPVKQKELTPVKQSEPERFNEKLSNQPQNVNFPVKSSDNFSGPGPVKKLPKKMHFKGKKGRQRTEAEVIDLLTYVQARNGAWPNDNYVSEQMRRYYRREYPEYFRKARKAKKVQPHGSAPIDLQTRRSGTGV